MKSGVMISGKRLQITRSFDAPRLQVFGWWAKAEKLQQWSGCKEAIACEVEMDFRVGGTFTQKMRLAVNGGEFDYVLTGTYDDIVEPERIAYHAIIGSAVTRVVLEFFEQGKGTKLVLTHDGLPDDFHCTTVSQGTTESLDKLESLIGSMVVPR